MGILAILPSSVSAKLVQYSAAFVTSLVLFWKWVSTGGAALRIKERQVPRKLLDDYNHKYITLPSGVNMHYVEAGNPTSPLMVMVHGYPEFWYSWRFQIEHFKDRYRVVAIDQRGYGGSSKPANIEDYSVALLAKDVDDLIHELGHQDAVVLGHDWGAAVAWAHSLFYPQSVQRLVICNLPHPFVLFDMIENNERQRAASWYMFFYQTPWVPEAAIAVDDFKMFDILFRGKEFGLRNRDNFTKDDLEAWKATFSQPDALRGPLNYYRYAIQHPEDLKLINKKCTVKTLIVWGEDDKALLREGAEASAKPEWCDDCTLHFIPNASHWVQQDAPEAVNRYIDNFLAELNYDRASL